MPTNTIQFPDQRNFEEGVKKLHLSLRELRVAVGEDGASSTGRAIARLHVEFIGDLLRLKDRFDYFIAGNLFMRDLDCALKDNFRQELQMLGMYSKLSSMLIKASDGLMACVGGYETIGIEVLANWAAAGNPTGKPDPGRLQVLESVTAFVQARNVERKQRKKT